jgi:hypothetical protein
VKATIIALLVLLSISVRLSAQTRTICGRVVYEDLEVISDVRIQTQDKLIVGKTDGDGRFKISIPQNTKSLKFSWIGMEPATIKLNNDCDTVEVVMLSSGVNEFASSKEIDRERLERFNKLPELHFQAYKKGIFAREAICYTPVFVPEKPQLDSIGKEIVETREKIKLAFKRLNVGDTVRIPFSDAGGYRADGTDRITLTAYSSYTGGHGHHSGCIISCVILSKNRHTRLRRFRYRNYNIVCQVIDCNGCKDPSVYEDKVMKPGVIFSYNMRYGEILGTQNFK